MSNISEAKEAKKNLTGRIATHDDVEVVERLVQYAFRGGKTSAKSWTGEEHLVRGPRITVEELHKIVDAVEHVILLAELGNGNEKQLVGCIQVTQEGDHAHIGMLAVDPDVQSVGAGKFLMSWAERHAADEFKSKDMIGEVVSGRPELMDWYMRLGYEQTGETAPFNPPGVTALVEGLHFIKIRKPLNSAV